MSSQKSPQAFLAGVPNRRALINGAVTVVVLALVLLGFVAFGAGKASKNAASQETGSVATQARGPVTGDAPALGATSSVALESKTTTEPAPNSKSGSSGSQGSGSNGGSGSGGGSEAGGNAGAPDASGKIADIRAALPKAFAGYAIGVPSKQGADAVVSATPSASTAAAQRLIWAVHDRGSASAAKAFVSNVSKKTYEVDGADVKVGGVSAYYGTDGMRFATVVFVKGQYVFEVLGSVPSGDPGVVRPTVLAAAQAFPVLSAE